MVAIVIVLGRWHVHGMVHNMDSKVQQRTSMLFCLHFYRVFAHAHVAVAIDVPDCNHTMLEYRSQLVDLAKALYARYGAVLLPSASAPTTVSASAPVAPAHAAST